MRIQVLAVLAVACGALVPGSAEVSASGLYWYRANTPVRSYCFEGPRWNYSAAYYSRRAHYGSRARLACMQARRY